MQLMDLGTSESLLLFFKGDIFAQIYTSDFVALFNNPQHGESIFLGCDSEGSENVVGVVIYILDDDRAVIFFLNESVTKNIFDAKVLEVLMESLILFIDEVRI